jgi:hypothetical protein
MNLTVPELEGLNWQDKLAYLVYQFSQIPDQIDCPVAHSFVGDTYIREMRIPAGTLFIGRPHTHGHLVQLVEGSVVVHTHGIDYEKDAPFEFTSEPGFQAVFTAVTDVVGRTVHPNPDQLRDVQVLEDRDFGPVAALLARGEQIRRLICRE